jgi:hypothetical protein
MYYITGQQVEEGGTVPEWFGLSYRDYDKDVYVCHVMPFNLIVALVVWLKIKIRFCIPTRISRSYEKKLLEMEQIGYSACYDRFIKDNDL